VTVEGILEHEAALQAAAEAGGNRLSGAPGYDASVDYVADRARAAGYDVMVQDFEYQLDFLADWEAPVLAVEDGEAFVPGIAGASFGGDFGSMYKTTPYATDITAPVWAIDLVLPPGGEPNTSTSGCEASDYDGVPDGAIIIVQRGTCTFAQKFTLADASGAGGMVFINEGQEGRTEPLWFNFDGLDIPTFAATVREPLRSAIGVDRAGLAARHVGAIAAQPEPPPRQQRHRSRNPGGSPWGFHLASPDKSGDGHLDRLGGGTCPAPIVIRKWSASDQLHGTAGSSSPMARARSSVRP
jgi:hypothetical protein